MCIFVIAWDTILYLWRVNVRKVGLLVPACCLVYLCLRVGATGVVEDRRFVSAGRRQLQDLEGGFLGEDGHRAQGICLPSRYLVANEEMGAEPAVFAAVCEGVAMPSRPLLPKDPATLQVCVCVCVHMLCGSLPEFSYGLCVSGLPHVCPDVIDRSLPPATVIFCGLLSVCV